jgi:type I restriction enzyme M protein
VGATATLRNGTNGSLHQRRQQLFELHSFLRSVDNLRPDEALDEIAKLFELWGRLRSFEGVLPDAELCLSDSAAQGAVERLAPLLAEVQPGHGAELFQELADVGVRAGMGQYFTPSPVAEAIAAFVSPKAGETWLDPFCGSGLLLGRLTSEAAGDLRLFGIDRYPLVLHLAWVEALLHHPSSEPQLLVANALEDPASLLKRLGAPPEGVDGIVTNPPFGAEVHEADQLSYAPFELGGGRVPLEVLGLEQSVRLLRPGGRLGIVLPQSILSNRSLQHVREFVLAGCVVDGVLSLPSETFLPFKGVGKASVLFLTRQAARPNTRVRLGVSRRVGWDATGKSNGEHDVAATAAEMRAGDVDARRLGSIEQGSSLARNLTAEWLLRPHIDGRSLGDLCSVVFTGKSPGRAAYEVDAGDESAYRMLKVGDLTNHGIDWSLGERSLARLPKRPAEERLLQLGDLATTAAAHHPRYIAAKVDYVDCLPTEYSACVPVAEVLVFRPRPEEIDPFVLLLWLRSPEGREAVQSCVTGQTAHLRAADVSEVIVPSRILSIQFEDAVAALRESLLLQRRSEASARLAVQRFVDAQPIISS